MRAIYTHIYVRWLLSGLSFALAFQASWLWPLGLVGVWWFLFAWQQSGTGREIFLGSWLAGSLKAAGAISWYWSIYPLDWLGFAPGAGQLLLIGVYWVSTAVAMGIGFAFVFYLLRVAIKSLSWQLVLLPGVWILAEVAGSVTFSVYSWGPGVLPNADFSFGYVGYLVSDLGLFVPFAQLAGVYGLSLIFIALCLLAYSFTPKRPLLRNHRHYLFLVVGALSFLVLLWSQTIDTPTNNQNIVAIQTSYDPADKQTLPGRLTKQEGIQQAVTEAITDGAEIILLPEDAGFTTTFPSTAFALEYITRVADGRALTVIDSVVLETAAGYWVVRAFIYDTETQSVSVVDKQELTPMGEFAPYLHTWLAGLIGGEAFKEKVAAAHNFQPGPERSYDLVPPHVPPILFCFESVSPWGVKNVLQQRSASVVLHQVSHGWFNEPDTFWLALDRMLTTQAHWNNVTIIEAGNMSGGSKQYP